jgi:cell division protein FtsL
MELELLISGLPDIDLSDLRAHTDYTGYKATDPTIELLWTVVSTFSKEEKALFIQFFTGYFLYMYVYKCIYVYRYIYVYIYSMHMFAYTHSHIYIHI